MAMTTTDEQQPVQPIRETAAQRRARPSADDIAIATAEQFGVCIQPMVMQRVDTTTGELTYVPVPCGNTNESVCGPCATKARLLRMAQCREGWHMTTEPVADPTPPTSTQTELLALRADLVDAYRAALAADELDHADELREEIRSVDAELVDSGMRGKLPSPEPPAEKTRVRRSTRRRQDAPNLPRKKIANTTIGQVFAGKHQPSMFVTLTLDSYGPINRDGATNKHGNTVSDGTPKHSGTYDYRRAARDAVHFAKLVDRWIQNLRRAVGWDVQYFATVEPQKRGAPHLHIAIRGAIPRDVLRMVTAATYHQVWWPNHDTMLYPGDLIPVWNDDTRTFTDPTTRTPLTTWDDAMDTLDDDEDAEPAHVVRFGAQVDIKGILGGTEEAGRHIGYLTKYLTKSVGEVLDADTARQHAHYDRLHTELEATPCSPRCGIWLRYGIVPKGANPKTQPGRCKAKAHRRTTLGLSGRRVLVSRKWSGKTLPDHRADRTDFVRQMLADIGIRKPADQPDRYQWFKTEPGDPAVPQRKHLLMASIAQRTTWKAEYDRAILAATGHPPSPPETSATSRAAA